MSDPSSSDSPKDEPDGVEEDPSMDDDEEDEPSAVFVHDCRLWHPVTTSDKKTW